MIEERTQPRRGDRRRGRGIKIPHSLAGAVAVVAGATRGAGRGIARALGEAGATVYCTGRSAGGKRSEYNRPETVDETAELIRATGGSAIAIRTDHTVEAEVKELFRRIDAERGRLDILVNSIAGEDPSMTQWCSFWKTDLGNAEKALRQSLLSHIITAKHAAPYMIRRRGGLIVEVTESDLLGAGGNPITQAVKLGLKGLAFNMAAELRPYGVACVSITPGFLRSEQMLERLGVTGETWQEAGKRDPNFLESESAMFIGYAIAALAGDPKIMQRSGQLTSSWEVAREYGFTDSDGRRPDWGALSIDFSSHPSELLQLTRDSSEIQLQWLESVRRNTKRFLAKLPNKA